MVAKSKRRKSKTHRAPGRRAGWSGNLRFGLVSFAVEAFNARLPERGGVAFHQLHAECHRRVKYDKQCPVHGHVDQSEIVSGYEYAKGKYVEIDPAELNDLRTEKERSLSIDQFVAADVIDPVFFDGRMYYLTPGGDEAREPYVVFLQALEHSHRLGIGQIIFSGKEQVALIRPYAGVLHMALLNYVDEMRDPESVIGSLPSIKSTDRKVKLAEQIIENWSTDDFDFADYEDHYQKKVRELIEAKVEGREVVTPTVEEEPEVINLMEALQQSVRSSAKSKRSKSATTHGKRRASKSRRAS